MASTNEQLRGLFPQEQITALDRVREELLTNPGAREHWRQFLYSLPANSRNER